MIQIIIPINQNSINLEKIYTIKNYPILIIDNKSNFNIEKKDNITIIKTDKILSPGQLYNLGIENSTEDILTFLHPEDIDNYTNNLEQIQRLFVENLNLKMVQDGYDNPLNNYTLAGKYFDKTLLSLYGIKFNEEVDSNICEFNFIYKLRGIAEAFSPEEGFVCLDKYLPYSSIHIEDTKFSDFLILAQDTINFLESLYLERKLIFHIATEFLIIAYFIFINCANQEIEITENDFNYLREYFEKVYLNFKDMFDPSFTVFMYNTLFTNIFETENFLYKALTKFNKLTFIELLELL